MNNSVVLDIDGCLADFEGAFCKKFGWEKRWLVGLEKRYPECADEIDWFVQSPETYKHLDILETGAKIARFCENEGMKIHIVSSRPKSTEDATIDWITENKIPFHYLSVGHLQKLQVIERANPMFILDDMLGVVDACAEVGIPSFLVDHPWNCSLKESGIIYRVRNFDEFLGKFTTYFDD